MQPDDSLSANRTKSRHEQIGENCCRDDTMTSRRPFPDNDGLAPDVRRAAHYIDSHLDDAMTISDVAAAAGVAHRTLYKHFHDERGTSPMRYVRDCRFAQVHEALLQAGTRDSVTSIAMQCGFRHLGRFSIEYRKRYGETPSETLRRPRG
jgi:transcriptional regulator GlxA family with amidase domain